MPNRPIAIISVLFVLCGGALGQSTPISRTYRLDDAANSRSTADRQLTASIGPAETPGFTLSAWGDRCSFSVNLADNLSSETGSRASHSLYATPDGGFEWETLVSSMPDTNVFTYRVEHHGLSFHYQDTLTDLEKADGARRPDSVIGSYAVYQSCPTVTGTRGTGKAFHLYRPKAWDSSGDTVWCDLLIDGTHLTLTIPDWFLARAKYPVVVDPHFGSETVGGSTVNFSNSYNYAQAYVDDLFTAPENAVIDSLFMYFVYADDSAALAIYACGVDGRPAGSPTARSPRIGSTSAAQWVAAAVNITLTTGTTYAIVEAENMSDATRVAYDTFANSCPRCSGSSFCDPWFLINLRSYRYSAYAVYSTNELSTRTTNRRRLLTEGIPQ